MTHLLKQVDKIIVKFNREFGMDQQKHLRFQLTMLRKMIVEQVINKTNVRTRKK